MGPLAQPVYDRLAAQVARQGLTLTYLDCPHWDGAVPARMTCWGYVDGLVARVGVHLRGRRRGQGRRLRRPAARRRHRHPQARGHPATAGLDPRGLRGRPGVPGPSRQPDRLPRPARGGRPVRRGDRVRPRRRGDDRRLPRSRPPPPRADSSHGQGRRRRCRCGGAVVCRAAPRGRSPRGRRGSGPASGDDLGGRCGAVGPLPRLPVRARHVVVARHGYAELERLPGRRDRGRLVEGTELHRPARPSLVARRRPDPDAGRPPPSRRTSPGGSRTTRGRDAGLPDLVGRPGRGPGRHGHADGALRAARPGRGGRERHRARRTPVRRRRRRWCRCGARWCSSSRSARTAGGSTAAAEGGPVYVVPRSQDVVVGGTVDEGAWDRSPTQPSRSRFSRGRSSGCPQLGKARVLAPGRARPRPPGGAARGEQTPSGRVVHCYGHGGAGVTLSWGCADEVAGLVGL